MISPELVVNARDLFSPEMRRDPYLAYDLLRDAAEHSAAGRFGDRARGGPRGGMGRVYEAGTPPVRASLTDLLPDRTRARV